MNHDLDKPENHEDLIRIGKLGKSHGLQGEIRLYSLSDVPNRFNSLDTVWWESQDGNIKRLKVVGIRPVKRFFLIRFEDYDTLEKVKKLSNGYLAIPKAERGNLPAGRYFIDDIIGLKVIDQHGQEIGHIKDVWQPGPNDVYEIQGRNGEIMIPVIDDVVKEINVQDRFMVIKV